ncbi:hypothetical protein TYRP_003400 [Tyrophagus putrescentiae]|nr:hypothetical protein TYRP_003400 [Tyrophagus putrescentiae]
MNAAAALIHKDNGGGVKGENDEQKKVMLKPLKESVLRTAMSIYHVTTTTITSRTLKRCLKRI